jgi:transposase
MCRRAHRTQTLRAGAVRFARLTSASAGAHWLCLTMRILPAHGDWLHHARLVISRRWTAFLPFVELLAKRRPATPLGPRIPHRHTRRHQRVDSAPVDHVRNGIAIRLESKVAR